MQHETDYKEIIEQIRGIKEALGERLLILTHHYQRKDIVDLGDCLQRYELTRR